MALKELLAERNMSQYRLAKESGVPKTTIVDLCSGKTSVEKCSVYTIYRICKVLGVSMESFVEQERSKYIPLEHRNTFEIFKNNVCHALKDKGDIDFILDTLLSDEIRTLYDKKWYPEAFYLLAMLDYISKENDVPLCTRYDDIRAGRLMDTLYPISAILSDMASGTDYYKEMCMKNAIPEFKRFNIVETEVRDAY